MMSAELGQRQWHVTANEASAPGAAPRLDTRRSTPPDAFRV
ncbi:hypothetical protein [Methylobacterium brachythecii]|nr:hypothetical protein [Methylobacterium brachythecii]